MSRILPQLPRQISWNSSEYVTTLPVEVVGWIAKQVGLQAASWLLVVAEEAKLPANLVVRGPVPVNVTFGHSHSDNLDTDIITGMANAVKEEIKKCSRLGKMFWRCALTLNGDGWNSGRGSVLCGHAVGSLDVVVQQ